MYKRQITGCIVEGPISLDLAMKPDVARAKQYESPCAGDVDVLIMPNLVTGNVYSKSIEMLGAEPLGIFLLYTSTQLKLRFIRYGIHGFVREYPVF